MAINFDNLDLDAIRGEAENKHKNLVVEGVVFRGLIHMPKDERAEFRELVSEFRDYDGNDKDAETFYTKVLTLVAADKERATDLLAKIGSDLAVLDTLVSLYFERTQVGEA